MDPRLSEAFALLPDYFGNHVLVSMTALALGLAVSLPLAFACLRRPTLRTVLLSLTSIIQTVPGLALLALFYPLLLGAASLSARWLGVSFSALGFLPAVLALALYSMLPILRNTITGLTGIDPAITEAAQGVGMTRLQSLRMVEVPLALPVIMAGIRTSAVWVIGTATLSTPIGQTSLGNYIFAGLQTQNWIFVLFGCVAAALLALATDQLLALIESGVGHRHQRRVLAGAAGLAVIIALAFVSTLSRPAPTYLVGAKPFSEQYILAALIKERLSANGLSAGERTGLGSAVILDALAANEIDAYVDYTGTIWANQMHRTDIEPRAQVLADVASWLKRERNVTLLGDLGFENAYALAMSKSRANELGVRSLADLAAVAPKLVIAGDYEFFQRPEWDALRKAYGLSFRGQRQMQAEFMYPALAAGEVDVIAAYTSDGRIAQYGLDVLADPKQAIPPYDAILLIAPKRADDARFIEALHPLLGAINVKLMRDANARASADGTSPDRVAHWMWEQIENTHAGASFGVPASSRSP
jgi:osmoprotectant transport system permease protein